MHHPSRTTQHALLLLAMTATATAAAAPSDPTAAPPAGVATGTPAAPGTTTPPAGRPEAPSTPPTPPTGAAPGAPDEPAAAPAAPGAATTPRPPPTPAPAAGVAASPEGSATAGTSPATPAPAPTAAEAASDDAGSAQDSRDPRENGTERPTDRDDMTGDAMGSAKGTEVGMFNVRFLLQTRYTATFSSSSASELVSYPARERELVQNGDGWEVQRAMWRVGVTPNKRFDLKTLIDLADLSRGNADSSVKQAHGIVHVIPGHMDLVAGLFKIPYCIMELDAQANYELADLGHADDLVKQLGFGGRDAGAELLLAPFEKAKLLKLAVGAFRGNTKNENDSPVGAIAARAETVPLKGLRLGVDWVEHPKTTVYERTLETSSKENLPVPPYTARRTWLRGRAFSADATFARWGLMVRGEALMGDRVDHDTAYGAGTWAAAWGLVAYTFRVGPIRLMPTARIEYLDTDREAATGVRRELSAGLNVLFSKRIRALVDVTRTDVQTGSPVIDPPKPLVDPPYMELDATRLVAQLQLQL